LPILEPKGVTGRFGKRLSKRFRVNQGFCAVIATKEIGKDSQKATASRVGRAVTGR
jgi:hypothetical protein